MNVRERRAIILGAAAIVMVAVIFRGAPWVLRRVAVLNDRATESSAAMARAQRLLEAAAMNRDSLAAALAAVVALAPRLVESGTAAEAGAALAGHVTVLASQNSLRLVRIDPLPDSGGVIGRVAVRAELEGDVKGLTRFLGMVERGQPLLTVPTLAISALSATTAPREAERLRIEATVAGLYLRRAAR